MKFFGAHSVLIGTCKNASCRCVHIQLVDSDDVPHAQAVMACDQIESLVADLRAVRDQLIGTGPSKGAN